MRPVSVITVTCGGYFFVRLLVEQVRKLIGDREYEIIAVDRGSANGTSEWLKEQPDVRVIRKRTWWFSKQHRHGDDAEEATRAAKYEYIALLDSNAFPIDANWLDLTVDKLDDRHPLAGAKFVDKHEGNPHGWYIHPHFMTYRKSDLGRLIILRKIRGHTTDTGEEATIRVLEAGREIIAYPSTFANASKSGISASRPCPPAYSTPGMSPGSSNTRARSIRKPAGQSAGRTTRTRCRIFCGRRTELDY